MIRIGSIFSGIGGFEKGIEDAFEGFAKTIWQVEQNTFCHKILKKHWPNASIFDDVRTVGEHNLAPVDIICGGFPCQSISLCGKLEGLKNDNKSGLWWEMHRVIRELQPRIAVLENVANVLSMGGTDVVGSLTEIGYNCEWQIIRASDFGAPHSRRRWFCVAYPNGTPSTGVWEPLTTSKKQSQSNSGVRYQSLWKNSHVPKPAICRMDDGISGKLDAATNRIRKERLKALGNAIVPKCSEYVAMQIIKSGLLDDLLTKKN